MGYASPHDGGGLLDLRDHASSRLPVTGVMVQYPPGHQVPAHSHSHGHVLHALDGLLLVETAHGRWLVPPTAAVWIQPGIEHRVSTPLGARTCGLFIHEGFSADLPPEACVWHVSPLLRELVICLVAQTRPRSVTFRDRLVGRLLLEELKRQQSLPSHLPWPRDPVIRQVCQALVEAPECRRMAGEWASLLSMSTKTFQRRFCRETGLSFGRWRQQMRLLHSLPLLLAGTPLLQVALSCGYESHGAYTQAFRKRFGCPPSRFSPVGQGAHDPYQHMPGGGVVPDA